jgi:hypothetical protein
MSPHSMPMARWIADAVDATGTRTLRSRYVAEQVLGANHRRDTCQHGSLGERLVSKVRRRIAGTRFP